MKKQLLKYFSLIFIMQFLLHTEVFAQLKNDYGYQGTIEIEVGETKYIPLIDKVREMIYLSTTYYPNGKWVLSNNFYNATMVSQSMEGCKVRGDKKGDNVKLTFSGNMILYDAMWDYTGYYIIKVVDPAVCVSSISLDANSLSLKKGETKQINATISPSNATNKSVSWSSSNTSVATVSSSGLITAKSSGSATITCKANDKCGVYATCYVTVKEYPTGVFTAKTIEGVVMKFYGSSNGTCFVDGSSSSPAIAKDTKGVITIPSEIEGSKVIRISNSAFYQCSEITQINIPSSVETIDGNAFKGCTSLTSASLGGGVKKLDYSAFEGCTSLTSITGLDKIEYVGSNAFGSSPNYTPWYNNLPDGLVYIGKSLYKYKGTMPENTTVNVKEGTLQITSTAIYSKNGLVGLTIPKSLKEIGTQALHNCRNLASISVVSGNETFDSPNNCNAIINKSTNSLILGCKNSAIPSTVKTIGLCAFSGSGITSVSIPNNVDSLASNAFSGCSSLEEIKIGNSLRKIGNEAFRWCDKVKYITIASDNPYFDSRYNCNAIVEKATNTLIIGFPSSTIPSSVKMIGKDAFYNILSLTSIVIPNGVESIGDYAFRYTGLITLTLGKDIKDMGKGTFVNSYLSTIISKSSNPIDIDETVFNCYERATLYVPVGSKSTYLSKSGWSKFKNIVEGEPSPEPSTKGDVNGDGQANGTDLVALTNIILGKNAKTDAADVNGDGQVNGTDYVALVNIVLGRSQAPRRAASAASISIDPAFSIKAGETKEMVINLTNVSDDITLVQFDLRLPSGLTLKQTGGEYDIDIAGRTTWRKHSLDANATNGIIRFLLASSSNATLEGASGAIIKITLKADNGYTGGTVKLENILLVTPAEKEIKPADVSYTIGSTGISGIITDGTKADAPIYSLSGQRLTAPKKGINIIGGKKVVVK